MAQDDYKIFSITPENEGYKIKEVQGYYKSGISCRKAHNKDDPGLLKLPFQDNEFVVDLQKGSGQKLRRIFQFYNKESPIFSEDYFKQFHLEQTDNEKELPSFLSQFSMIDREYIKTRFFTKLVNKQGQYKYFVRRNGEYYVEYIDDTIPVSGPKQLPLWGLNLKEPWKIIIMKAWLKEKGGIEGVKNAKPYEFIDAFGLPGYRALSIKKQMDFLKFSNQPAQSKLQKEKRIKLNEPGYIIVGKTRDNQMVVSLGLKRNCAGYKIVPIKSLNASSVVAPNNQNSLYASSIANEQNIYKVHSELPSYWVGEHSVVNRKIKEIYNPQVHKLNIEKEFLATYTEISNVFSKFYIAPEYSSKKCIEDSYRVQVEDNEPYCFFELVVETKGSLNLNIELPLDSAFEKEGHLRYSPIKYFMTKKKPEEEGNKFSGYKFYDGEYVKGYHKSLNRFLQIEEGTYYIYVKIDNSKKLPLESFAININTTAELKSFQKYEVTSQIESSIIKSTFYEYSKQAGIRCYVHKEVKDLLVYICNKFDELGFAFISLYVHQKAKGSLAMDINCRKLLQNKVRICPQSQEDGYAEGEDRDNVKIIATPSDHQILVLERTETTKSKEEQFPPEGSIDFYEIY